MDTSAAQPDYPVQVKFAVPDRSNRFWAIPLLGLLIKLIILIPHLIVLYVLEIVVGVLQLVLWIPVLFGGIYPGWGYMSWSADSSAGIRESMRISLA